MDSHLHVADTQRGQGTPEVSPRTVRAKRAVRDASSCGHSGSKGLPIGQDFSFVLWILKIVLLNVRPNLFCDFTSRQWFCTDNFGQVL
jgi:hypothetical protein